MFSEARGDFMWLLALSTIVIWTLFSMCTNQGTQKTATYHNPKRGPLCEKHLLSSLSVILRIKNLHGFSKSMNYPVCNPIVLPKTPYHGYGNLFSKRYVGNSSDLSTEKDIKSAKISFFHDYGIASPPPDQSTKEPIFL